MFKDKYRKDLIPSKGSLTKAQYEYEIVERNKAQLLRRQFREKILEALSEQNDGALPLPKACIQVIDSSEIDKTILNLIENGEVNFTDNLFFKLINESPQYLAYEPFQQKIALWQALLNDSSVKSRIRDAAKERLMNIGSALSFVGSGRHSRKNETPIYFEFVQTEESLKPVMKKIKTMYIGNKKLTFKEMVPHLSKYADLLYTYKTSKALAKQIICEKFGMSERSLEDIISKHERSIIRTRKLYRQSETD